jgi:polyhydroxyalkanoate synthesis regulator phasin
VENGALRDLLQQLGLAVIGAASLTAERADVLADELAARGGMRRDEALTIINEATGRWRGEAGRLGERAGAVLEDFFRDVGLVTRESFEELELRVAQLEHRLRLLEETPLSGENGSPRSVP